MDGPTKKNAERGTRNDERGVQDSSFIIHHSSFSLDCLEELLLDLLTEDVRPFSQDQIEARFREFGELLARIPDLATRSFWLHLIAAGLASEGPPWLETYTVRLLIRAISEAEQKAS